ALDRNAGAREVVSIRGSVRPVVYRRDRCPLPDSRGSWPKPRLRNPRVHPSFLGVWARATGMGLDDGECVGLANSRACPNYTSAVEAAMGRWTRKSAPPSGRFIA